MRLFTVLIALVVCMVPFAHTAEKDTAPVFIEFEKTAQHVDIATGLDIPDFTRAQRGSFQFFMERLDVPEDFIRYFHDGRQRANVSVIKSMEKFNARCSQWRVRFNTRGESPQYIPRVYSLAVSFIPIDAATGEARRRVYVLLDDLRKIDWESGAGK